MVGVLVMILREEPMLMVHYYSHHPAKGSSSKVARCKCHPMGHRDGVHGGSKQLPISSRCAHLPWDFRSSDRAVVDADQ